MARKPAKGGELYAPNRIRELREAQGLVQEELGARAGHLMRGEEIAISTIQKLEARKQALTLDYMLAIAGALGVAPTALISSSRSNVRMVPMLGRISAGKWREALQLVEEMVAAPEGHYGPSSFALKPVGDSMDKIVGEDGYIVVDPDDRDLIDGKIYALANGDGDTTFKRYRANPPRLEPCSNNPDHQTIMVGREPFTVLARVVYAGVML